MEFRKLLIFFMFILCCVSVNNGYPAPNVFLQRGVKLHDRVKCQYEEPTEDMVCLEHCLPKGYSFGFCNITSLEEWHVNMKKPQTTSCARNIVCPKDIRMASV
ncbi:hypothetical protein RR48_14264 [Papilio machaon]|uniref:Single domain-containing protein n=1 Tax=Papilio machaon TaxID=76193 RepID=A0A194QNH3_PAPMA|nr:hypothetical protein RR48_14264 [Papilio machaon]